MPIRMYIRTKKRRNQNGKEYAYAYLVSSKYRKKYPKQKIIKYCGRIWPLNQTDRTPLIDKIKQKKGYETLPFKEMSLLLLKQFLDTYGLKNRMQNKEGITIDLDKKTVTKEGANITLELNKGLVNNFTLSRFLDFKTPNKSDFEVGKELAKRMLDLGIEPEKELFLMVFHRLRQEYNSLQQ